MHHRPRIALILALLLVASLTGQALAAYRMPCADTPNCCCRAMSPTPVDAHGMAQAPGNCCDPVPAQPCDWNTLPSGVNALPGAVISSADLRPLTTALTVSVETVSPPLTLVLEPADAAPLIPSGPPIYLRNQNLLC